MTFDEAGNLWHDVPERHRHLRQLPFRFPDSGGQIGPFGGLIFDALGNLFGTPSENNSGSGPPAGAVFKLSPSLGGGWNCEESYGFTGFAYLESGVILGPDGYLYGITTNGGAFNGGIVFAITPQ